MREALLLRFGLNFALRPDVDPLVPIKDGLTTVGLGMSLG
jgi:hypothetical protein